MRNRVFGTLLVLGLAAGGDALAADHRDSPSVIGDASTDINDVYAWMSPDGAKVYLAMTVFPGASAAAKFSDKALYVFHVNRFKMFGDPVPMTSDVICRFTTDQKISCWAPGSEFVSGDATAMAGIQSTSAKMKVFAGLRDDPFFFNIAGFRNVITTGKGALVVEPKACPQVPEMSANALAGLLSKDATTMGPGKDGFAKDGDAVMGGYSGNTLAIVIAIDKSLLVDAERKVLGVWASTNMPQ